MGKRLDEQKRAAWEERLSRFRVRGGTIAKFCRDEGVSDRVFQYWARRIRAAGPRNAKQQATPAQKHRPPSASAWTNDEGMIHVRLGRRAQFSIPTDALDALRCVLSWLRDTNTRRGREVFQHVVLSAR